MSSGQAIFMLLCDKHQTIGPAGEEKAVPCWFCENEKLRAENERLRDGLREILATEDHAGPVCGHCKSRIARAASLYKMVDLLLGEDTGPRPPGRAPPTRREGLTDA